VQSIFHANEFSLPIMTNFMFLVFTERSCGNEVNKRVARNSGIENYAKLCIEKSS
jgi:hypothetical protein